jgi:type VI secretion system protein ImpC
LPYGKDTGRIEQFDFEEMPHAPVHQDYLWGNPAFICAVLLAQAFNEERWQMRPGTVLDVGGLPVHSYRENGELQVKPCAEVWLTVDAIEAILDQGLIPLASVKGRDDARLVRFQSLAGPLRPLAGRWS